MTDICSLEFEMTHGTFCSNIHKLLWISNKDITQFSTSFMLRMQFNRKSKGYYTLHLVSSTLLRVRCSHWCFLQKYWVTGGNSCAHRSIPSKLPVSEDPTRRSLVISLCLLHTSAPILANKQWRVATTGVIRSPVCEQAGSSFLHRLQTRRYFSCCVINRGS